MHFWLFFATLEHYGNVFYKRYINLFFDSIIMVLPWTETHHHGVVISPHPHEYSSIYFNSNPNTTDIPQNPQYYRQYCPHARIYFTYTGAGGDMLTVRDISIWSDNPTSVTTTSSGDRSSDAIIISSSPLSLCVGAIRIVWHQMSPWSLRAFGIDVIWLLKVDVDIAGNYCRQRVGSEQF